MLNSPQDVLAAWLDGVNAGEADRVLELYAQGSVLVPTFSEKILNDRVGIEAYFLGLSKRGVSISSTDSIAVCDGMLPKMRPDSADGYQIGRRRG